MPSLDIIDSELKGLVKVLSEEHGDVVYDRGILKGKIKEALNDSELQVIDEGLSSANLWLDRAKAKMIEYFSYKNKIAEYGEESESNENKAMIGFLQRRMAKLKKETLTCLDKEIDDINKRNSLSENRIKRRDDALKFIKKIDGSNEFKAGRKIKKIYKIMDKKEKIANSENIKPGDYVVVPNMDIYEYPIVNDKYRSKNNTEITLGDLHGNSVKLLHSLLYHGFIQMEKQDYDDFVNLYKKSMNISKYNEYIGNIKKLEDGIQFDLEKIQSTKDQQEINKINLRVKESEKTLENLKRITNESVKNPFAKEDVEKINEIIKRIKCNNNVGMLRLIGDELADRGANDYFTLKILEKLSQGKVPFEIMMSNHSMEFLRTYEAGNNYTDTLGGGQSMSAVGLQYLMDKNFIETGTIKKIVESAYKPNLKAISYTLVGDGDSKKIIIHSHAAIDTQIIRKMSKELKLSYSYDGNVDKLAKTIDRINNSLKKHIKNNTLRELVEVDHNIKQGSKQIRDNESPNKALVAIIWNRSYEGEKPYKKDDATLLDPIELDRGSNKISYTYGHDPNGPDQYQPNINSTDNIHGKYNKDPKTGEINHNNLGVYFAHFVNKEEKNLSLDINDQSLKILIKSLIDFSKETKTQYLGKYEAIQEVMTEKDKQDKKRMDDYIQGCISELEKLDKLDTKESFYQLSEILGRLNKVLPLKGEEKIIKLYLDRVARGQEIKYVNFYECTDNEINPSSINAQLETEYEQVSNPVLPESSSDNKEDVGAEQGVVQELEVTQSLEELTRLSSAPALKEKNDNPNLSVQDEQKETKKSAGFLEKIKSMFNFSSKIQERKNQKKVAVELIAGYYEHNDVYALKEQDYSQFEQPKGGTDLNKFKRQLDILDKFSERETRVRNLLPHVKNDLQKNNNKFVKQEIRKLEKEVKKLSQKTIQTQIDLIGDYTSNCFNEIEKNPNVLMEIKEDIEKYSKKYEELTADDARKQNAVIKDNFDELRGAIQKQAASTTVKSGQASQQNDSKKRNLFVKLFNPIRKTFGMDNNKASQQDTGELVKTKRPSGRK